MRFTVHSAIRFAIFPLLASLGGLFSSFPVRAQSILTNQQLTDTLQQAQGVSITTQAEAFFYNAEFDHPLKVGYTLPGWRLSPALAYRYGHLFSVEAGWYLAQMIGERRSWRSLPMLRIASVPIQGLRIAMGALPPSQSHSLPDFLYSPNYRWLSTPELGVQIDYRTPKWYTEVWIDWERFIWLRAPENERFLFGARIAYGDKRQPGPYAHAFILVHHSGGQIDATTNPVITSTNMGGQFAYLWAWGANRLAVEADIAQSKDGDRNSPFTGKKGWLFRGQIAWHLGGFTLETAYIHAKRFYTLRGEELYASYSSWSQGRTMPIRQILSFSSSYEYSIADMLRFRLDGLALYDLKLRRTDWAFTFATAVDLNFWILSSPLKQ